MPAYVWSKDSQLKKRPVRSKSEFSGSLNGLLDNEKAVRDSMLMFPLVIFFLDCSNFF